MYIPDSYFNLNPDFTGYPRIRYRYPVIRISGTIPSVYVNVVYGTLVRMKLKWYMKLKSNPAEQISKVDNVIEVDHTMLVNIHENMIASEKIIISGIFVW